MNSGSLKWTWDRIAAAALGLVVALRILFDVAMRRMAFDPIGLIFIIVPVAIFVASWLYVFPVKNPSGRRTLRLATVGGGILGALGLAVGTFGPVVLIPDAAQGPLIGILFTGPVGFLFGFLGGAIVSAFTEPAVPPPPTHPEAR